jgi:Zn-dependent protease
MHLDFAHLVVWFIVFVFSTTFHEFAHAYAAYRGGDHTAYLGGQVSLDPIPHIRREPIGMVVVPILSFLMSNPPWMIGWASTPFDPEWGRRHPRRQALMSLAGPLANLLLAALALIALKVLISLRVFHIPYSPSFEQMVSVPGRGGARSPLGAAAMALSILLNLNVMLGLFNLIPLPPLDGAGVAQGLSPGTLGRFYARMRQIPMSYLLGLIIAWKVFGYIAWPALGLVTDLLY